MSDNRGYFVSRSFLACVLSVVPASVAQLDARPTETRRPRVRTPPRSATIVRGD